MQSCMWLRPRHVATCRWRQLHLSAGDNTLGRRRTSRAVLQQSQRLAARAEQPRRGEAARRHSPAEARARIGTRQVATSREAPNEPPPPVEARVWQGWSGPNQRQGAAVPHRGIQLRRNPWFSVSSSGRRGRLWAGQPRSLLRRLECVAHHARRRGAGGFAAGQARASRAFEMKVSQSILCVTPNV